MGTAVEPVRPRPVGRPRASADVRLQRSYDKSRGMDFPQLEARYQALMRAKAACGCGEPGAALAERQALIDLASAAEEMAARRPAPTVRFQSG